MSTAVLSASQMDIHNLTPLGGLVDEWIETTSQNEETLKPTKKYSRRRSPEKKVDSTSEEDSPKKGEKKFTVTFNSADEPITFDDESLKNEEKPKEAFEFLESDQEEEIKITKTKGKKEDTKTFKRVTRKSADQDSNKEEKRESRKTSRKRQDEEDEEEEDLEINIKKTSKKRNAPRGRDKSEESESEQSDSAEKPKQFSKQEKKKEIASDSEEEKPQRESKTSKAPPKRKKVGEDSDIELDESPFARSDKQKSGKSSEKEVKSKREIISHEEPEEHDENSEEEAKEEERKPTKGKSTKRIQKGKESLEVFEKEAEENNNNVEDSEEESELKPKRTKKNLKPSKTEEKDKSKAKKSPKSNASKRPPSAWTLFCKEQRPIVRKEHSNLSEANKVLSDMWKKMDKEKRKEYEEKAQAEKKRFDQNNESPQKEVGKKRKSSPIDTPKIKKKEQKKSKTSKKESKDEEESKDIHIPESDDEPEKMQVEDDDDDAEESDDDAGKGKKNFVCSSLKLADSEKIKQLFEGEDPKTKKLLHNVELNDVFDDFYNITHVIVDKDSPKRTEKVILGIAQGLWIVTSDWIAKSVAAGKWLPEEHFEAVKHFPGCKISRTREDDLLFDGMYFYIHMKPNFPQLKNVIANCGGKIVAMNSANICVSPNFKKTINIPVVDEKWVIDAITQQKKPPIPEQKKGGEMEESPKKKKSTPNSKKRKEIPEKEPEEDSEEEVPQKEKTSGRRKKESLKGKPSKLKSRKTNFDDEDEDSLSG